MVVKLEEQCVEQHERKALEASRLTVTKDRDSSVMTPEF